MSALRCGVRGGFAVRDAAGQWEECCVLPETALLPWCVVLRLRVEAAEAGRRDRRLSLTLPADCFHGREPFRALRVWLRWRADTSGASGVRV
ncbi:hypothetical protein GHK24_03695 [Rhodocyclus tenuis]|uniref:Uncharacterized protein n=1 Tax=Rhodocyclus tenuis TaxID=1066 RepID=A0A6L5JV12_RHOTE|nr:hypothetical protein [Rhodocyclus gracilis]MQY50881.1 hypothetical protein [Rhodocyclus gracilis]